MVTSDSSTVTLTLSSGTFEWVEHGHRGGVDGVATFSSLKIDTAGSYTLTATDGSLTASATSNSFTISPAAASKLVFGQQPTTHGRCSDQPGSHREGGGYLRQRGHERQLDGHPDAQQRDVRSGSSTATATASSGVATFSGLVIDTAGTYTLTATDGSLTGRDQQLHDQPCGGQQAGLRPAADNATAGVAISPAVTVKVEDTYSNVVTSNSSTVTLTLSSGTFASGSSTATATASSGVATFSGLIIDTAGSYTLSATDGSLTGATSNSLTISPAAASKLVFGQQPTNATAGVAISPAVTVKVEDPMAMW